MPAPARNSCSSSLPATADRGAITPDARAGPETARVSEPTPDIADCLIVGAGPAGLTAATYLARFHRRLVLVDAGKSRARWIPTSHNCPGFPFGIAGPALLDKLRAQACAYGVDIVTGSIGRLEREGALFRATAEDGVSWAARFVILGTGIVDTRPAMPGLEGAIARNVIGLCAVCDGYAASDERIAVFAPIDAAIRHALFLRTFSRQVAVVRSEPGEPSPECMQAAREARIALLPPSVSLRDDGRCCVFAFADGSEQRFDTVYPVLGCDAQSQLATALGAGVDDNDELRVDRDRQTSVDGLYAIGDVVSALNQISVAVGHAAIAATAIHNRLPRNFREDAGDAA